MSMYILTFNLCAATVHPILNISMASARVPVSLTSGRSAMTKVSHLPSTKSQTVGYFGAQQPSAGAKTLATVDSEKQFLNFVTARMSGEQLTDLDENSKAFNFKSYMDEKSKAVNAALDTAVPLQYPEFVTEAMRYLLLGRGKRIRPSLCIAACELVGGTQEIAMPTACAVEMVHTMSLIHDDMPCMENNDTRREVPTIHKKFGENMALLAADALLSYAFEHIARFTKGVDANLVVSTIARLGKAVGSEGLAGGQMLDLTSEVDSSEELKVLEYIHICKTAVLLEAAVMCGAIIGGGSDQEIEQLGRYARYVGLLFQVVADILDVNGTSEGQSKTAAGKFLTDRITYPKILGLEKTMELALDLNRKAKAELSAFDQEKAAPLLGLADYIAQREN